MWFKVCDSLHSHPKAIAAGDAALGLWVRIGAWCAAHSTGGEIPFLSAKTLAKGSKKSLGALVKCGLLEQPNGEGTAYVLHDWADYNPTAEEARAQKKKRSEAGRLGAARRWAKGSASSETDGKGDGKSDGKCHGKRHSKRHGKRLANAMAKRCPVPVPVHTQRTRAREGARGDDSSEAPISPLGRRLLGALRQHAALSSAATPDVAEALATNASLAGRRADAIVQAVADVAARAAMATASGRPWSDDYVLDRLAAFACNARGRRADAGRSRPESKVLTAADIDEWEARALGKVGS